MSRLFILFSQEPYSVKYDMFLKLTARVDSLRATLRKLLLLDFQLGWLQTAKEFTKRCLYPIFRATWISHLEDYKKLFRFLINANFIQNSFKGFFALFQMCLDCRLCTQKRAYAKFV